MTGVLNDLGREHWRESQEATFDVDRSFAFKRLLRDRTLTEMVYPFLAPLTDFGIMGCYEYVNACGFLGVARLKQLKQGRAFLDPIGIQGSKF